MSSPVAELERGPRSQACSFGETLSLRDYPRRLKGYREKSVWVFSVLEKNINLEKETKINCKRLSRVARGGGGDFTSIKKTYNINIELTALMHTVVL